MADGSGMDETFARADETVGNRDQHASLPIRHPFRSEALYEAAEIDGAGRIRRFQNYDSDDYTHHIL